jgi:hypothetical protein
MLIGRQNSSPVTAACFWQQQQQQQQQQQPAVLGGMLLQHADGLKQKPNACDSLLPPGDDVCDAMERVHYSYNCPTDGCPVRPVSPFCALAAPPSPPSPPMIDDTACPVSTGAATMVSACSAPCTISREVA